MFDRETSKLVVKLKPFLFAIQRDYQKKET